MNKYKEPELTIIVLDFQREVETRLCLESIKRHVKFPAKVLYYHNGRADYPYKFYQEGLCDTFVQTQRNEGLGIGTRDLYRMVFSPFVMTLQSDQIIGRDFIQDEFDKIKAIWGEKALVGNNQIGSISLAGPVCSKGVFSERAGIMRADFYQYMEKYIDLGYSGCGPYDGAMQWREGKIQDFYKSQDIVHYTEWPALVIDNGRTSERQNPDGSRWRHFPDTKQLWLISGPVKERGVYPKFTDKEWDIVLATQTWEPGKIPENEIPHSFRVWN
jgi:hypothetical protein